MDWLEIKEFIKDSIKYILTFVFVLFVIVYIVSVQQIVGPSMEPTLNSGDIVLLNKFGHRFFKLKRNQVIALNYEDTKYMVKRIIGLPGEKIEYKDNTLYINDKPYSEPFLKDVITEDFSLKELGYEVIPKDKYLVLGDNRENSMDSRNFGLISKKDIIGKTTFRIWPLNKIKIVK